MIQKEAIQKSFDDSAYTYDSVSEIQQMSSEYLADMVCSKVSKVNSILDIGCGTGNTTIEVLKRFPSAELHLCDISQKMLDIATQKMPKSVSVTCCDAEFFDFDGYYDLIISNLSFQWFENAINFIKRVRKRCATLAFSMLLNDSFKRYKELFLCPPTFKYPTETDLITSLPDLKSYKTKQYSLQFENFFAVAKYFRKMGASLSENPKWRVRSKCLNGDIKKYDKPIFLDYEVFFAVL